MSFSQYPYSSFLRKNQRQGEPTEQFGDACLPCLFLPTILLHILPQHSRWHRTSHELRKKHGANKPPQLMRLLIEYFTKHDELVLDPFAGVGGTLIGATIARRPRRAIGIEINRDWIDIYNQVVRQEKLAPQELILGDCMSVMQRMEDQVFDFINISSFCGNLLLTELGTKPRSA